MDGLCPLGELHRALGGWLSLLHHRRVTVTITGANVYLEN